MATVGAGVTEGKTIGTRLAAGLLALLTLTASACAHLGTSNRASPAMWRVQGAEGGWLHLLGSVHVGASGGWTLPPAVEDAFLASEVLVVEIDDGDVDADALVRQVHERASLPPQLRLSSVVSPETQALLETQLDALELDPALLEPYEPWFAAIVLVEQAYLEEGFSAADGVDRRLMERARGSAVIAGLETAEEQLDLLDGLPMSVQEAMLRDTLLSSDDLWSDVERLLDAWRRGDLDRLDELVFGDLERHPELAPFYEAVFFQRNERMADGFVRWLGSGRRVFGVIGAGHLIGERGVVALLRDRGYTVERVDVRDSCSDRPLLSWPCRAEPESQ